MYEQLPEQMQEVNNLQYDKINFLLQKLDVTPQLREDFYQHAYPQLIELGFKAVELTVSNDGEVKLETAPDLEDEIQIDTYTYNPANRLVEYQSVTRNFNDNVSALNNKFAEVEEEFEDYSKSSKKLYKEMLDMLSKEDGYEGVVNDDYDTLNNHIQEERNIIFDMDQYNNDWQNALNIRDANIISMLAAIAAKDPIMDKFLEEYRKDALGSELRSADLEVLSGQIDQAENVRKTDVIVADPQDFIKILERLSETDNNGKDM